MKNRQGANRQRNRHERSAHVSRVVKNNAPLLKRITGIGMIAALAIVLMIAGVVGVRTWFGSSDIFTVRHVAIRGAAAMDQKIILDSARVRVSMRMADVQPVAIEQRISHICQVRTVRVSRMFPGRVTITITPRIPVALVALGNVFMIDADGVLLPVKLRTFMDLPLITGVRRGADSVLPLRIRTADITMVNGFLAQARAADGNVSAQIALIDFSQDNSVRVMLKGSAAAIVLNREQINNSIGQLRQLLPSLKNSVAARHIDLRYANLAFVR